MIHPRHAKQERAGEDVLLNPVHSALQILVRIIRHGDHLEGEQAVRLQDLRAFGEVGFQILIAHRLEHFDAGDLIELPGDLPIILETNLNLVRKASRLHALHGFVVLGLRDGHARHPTPVLR